MSPRLFPPALEVFASLQPPVVDFRFQAEIRLLELQNEYRKAAASTPNYIVEGPGWTFATRTGPLPGTSFALEE